MKLKTLYEIRKTHLQIKLFVNNPKSKKSFERYVY
jgi:hypothetical protein